MARKGTSFRGSINRGGILAIQSTKEQEFLLYFVWQEWNFTIFQNSNSHINYSIIVRSPWRWRILQRYNDFASHSSQNQSNIYQCHLNKPLVLAIQSRPQITLDVLNHGRVSLQLRSITSILDFPNSTPNTSKYLSIRALCRGSNP